MLDAGCWIKDGNFCGFIQDQVSRIKHLMKYSLIKDALGT